MVQSTTRPQLWFIGGGDVHESREDFLRSLQNFPYDIGEKYSDWKSWITAGLADRTDTIKPDFPNKLNADYDAWKIWFEKYIQKYATSPTRRIIIAHSLGGIFIAKYLSENTFPGEIEAVHLVAPVLSDEGLQGEIVGNFAFVPESLSHLQKQTKIVHLWHSTDDPIVPYAHSLEYKRFLPESLLHTHTDRGHFSNQAHFVELFQEVLTSIG